MGAQACRLFVFLSLLETATVAFIVDKVSMRTAAAVDRKARVVLPLDFLAFALVFFGGAAKSLIFDAGA